MTERAVRNDIGFTHVALAVSNLDHSAAFYARYAKMQVVHRRIGSNGVAVAWLSDLTRPFVLVLSERAGSGEQVGRFAHLGIGCASRDEVDQLAEQAASEGCLRRGPVDAGYPVGYIAMLSDPDGHALELAFGQEVGLTVAQARERR